MRALCRRVTVLVGAVISLAAPAWAAMSADQVATAFSGGKAHGQLIPVLRNENPAIQCGICAPPFSAKDSGWKSRTGKGLASHAGPESCATPREVGREALTGETTG